MKYKNQKRMIDGIEFDSTKEAWRYVSLKQLEKEGVISDLTLQKEFVLVPAQRGPDTISKKGKTVPGKVIERAVKYRADFSYIFNGKEVVEDTKGFKTKDYIIKRKLMLWVHGIRIEEI